MGPKEIRERRERSRSKYWRNTRMRLHRYNLLQGKHLQLSSVKKYNMSMGTLVRSYYITLEAKDPATGGSLQNFQGNPRKASITGGGETMENFLDSKHLSSFMPELPPENPFQDDTNRFYVLKESELQDNDDWIRLYVELAVATTNRSLEKQGLANLKILKVAMESTRYLSQGLGSYDETFYIRYEDLCEARVGKDVDRVAIVRRILDEHSEILSLVGAHQSINAMEASSSSAQD